MEWQPIETAPKGQRVLVVEDGIVFLANWDTTFEGDWSEEEDRTVYRGAWTDHTVADWGMEEVNELHPTHWMPLPAPPHPKNQEGQS